MPNQTTSKRLPVSLKPDLYSVISDLATFHKKPMSKIVVELLEQMQPILEAQRDALKAVDLGLDPSKAILAMFASGFADMGDFGEELKEVIRKND